jgi:hypothetical protein
VGQRYQRASELLQDVMEAVTVLRTPASPVTPPRPPGGARRGGHDDAHSIQTRLRARESPAARFCWNCRKPLHARSDKCPFCGENQ